MILDALPGTGRFKRDISLTTNGFETSGLKIVRTSAEMALSHNFGRLNIATIMMALQHHNSLLLIDPVFRTINLDDIMAAYKIGSFSEEQNRELKMELTRGGKSIFMIARRLARSCVTDADIVKAVVKSDAESSINVTKLDLLHGLADLRSGEPRF